MGSKSVRAAASSIAILSSLALGRVEGASVSWMDAQAPAAWNTPDQTIPAAPKSQGPIDARCRALARPQQIDEDKRVRDRGWDLVGAYQGGWQVVVIRGTASYDGMCRPRQYQAFVFVRGAFAGTLSPQPMDSRSDGALGQVFLQNDRQLIAEYERYGRSDPLCCPSRTTRVVFDIGNAGPVVRPVSAATTATSQVSRTTAANHQEHGLVGVYWRAIELAGKPTPTQEAQQEAHLEFQSGGRFSGSDGCNRVSGSYQLNGDHVTFGQVAATQMACIKSSGTEEPFREALKDAARLTVEGGRLELFDAKGTRLGAFVAVSKASTSSPSPFAFTGTSWQLVKFQGSDDTTLVPGDRRKYTIQFDAGGQLTARIDCNRGRGTWKSSGASQIEFGPLALTRAQCPPGSLHDQIVKQWGNIRSYVVRDGHLFLALIADGGVYEFEPLVK